MKRSTRYGRGKPVWELLNKAREHAGHATYEAKQACEMIALARKELLRILKSDLAFASSLPQQQKLGFGRTEDMLMRGAERRT